MAKKGRSDNQLRRKRANLCDQRGRGVDSTQVKTADRGLRLQSFGSPGIPSNLRGESLLYENELPLRKVSIPNVNPRENKYKMRTIAEGRPTVRKKPAKVCLNAEFFIADEIKRKAIFRHSDAFPSKLRGQKVNPESKPRK